MRCIDAQTESSLEIIIVNDGSTDQTEVIILDMMKTLKKQCVYKCQKNQGEFLSRVNGVYSASGEYVAFMDADDEIGPDYVKSMMDIQNQRDADLLVCGIKHIKSGKVSIPSEKGYDTTRLLDSMSQLPGFIFGIFFNQVWNKFYKKELLKRSLAQFISRSQDEKNEIASLARDAYMNIQYFQFTRTISFTDYPQYIYNYNPDSITETFHSDYYKSMFFFCRENNKLLAKHCKGDFREESNKYLIENTYSAFSYAMHNARKERYSTRFSYFRAVASELQTFSVFEAKNIDIEFQKKVIFFLFRKKRITILTLVTYIPLAVMKKVVSFIQKSV